MGHKGGFMEVEEGALPNALSPFLDMSKSIGSIVSGWQWGREWTLQKFVTVGIILQLKLDWKRIWLIFFHLHYSIFIYYIYSMMWEPGAMLSIRSVKQNIKFNLCPTSILLLFFLIYKKGQGIPLQRYSSFQSFYIFFFKSCYQIAICMYINQFA